MALHTEDYTSNCIDRLCGFMRSHRYIDLDLYGCIVYFFDALHCL